MKDKKGEIMIRFIGDPKWWHADMQIAALPYTIPQKLYLLLVFMTSINEG